MRASRHRSMPRTSPSSSLQLYFHCFYLFFFSLVIISLPDLRSTPSINSTAVGSWRHANQLADTGSSNCRRYPPKRNGEMDGNGGIITEMMLCSTSWCPASPLSGCIVMSLFFTQKEFGDKGATGHGQMERVKGSMLRRRHVSIAPGAAVLPTHSVDLTATPSFSVVRSQ